MLCRSARQLGVADAGRAGFRETSPASDSDLARDDKHCGACNHDGFGGECVGGSCQIVHVGRVTSAPPNGVTVLSDGAERARPESVCFTATLPDRPGVQVYRIAKRLRW